MPPKNAVRRSGRGSGRGSSRVDDSVAGGRDDGSSSSSRPDETSHLQNHHSWPGGRDNVPDSGRVTKRVAGRPGSRGARQDAQLLLRLELSTAEQERAADATYRPNVEPTDDIGSYFNPIHVPDRDFAVRQSLPAKTPLQLLQHFLPESLVERWVRYTNEATPPEPGPGPAIKSGQHRRGDQWTDTSVAEICVWIGILIYMSLHKEYRFQDYWTASQADRSIPDHPIIQYITFGRFHLLKRRLKTWDTSCIELYVPDPFNEVNEWSDLQQGVSETLVEPGSIVAVDEATVGFKGRSRHKVHIKSKPTPTGLKVWVLAARGYVLRWLWHLPGPRYGPVFAEAAAAALRGSGRAPGQQPGQEPGQEPGQAPIAIAIEETAQIAIDPSAIAAADPAALAAASAAVASARGPDVESAADAAAAQASAPAGTGAGVLAAVSATVSAAAPDPALDSALNPAPADSSSDDEFADIISIYSSSSEDTADEAVEEAADREDLDEPPSPPAAAGPTKLPPLNPTQAVVLLLVSRLLNTTVHVIVDNLFSSPNLFRALRILGAGATGTCRTNCGLYKALIAIKTLDRKGQLLWPWGHLDSHPTSDG
jgi:hypothetical protein